MSHLKELNIVLLPSEPLSHYAHTISHEIKDQLKRNRVAYHDCPNTPHLSLYQFCCEEDNIPAILEVLDFMRDSIILETFKMDGNLTVVEENIFWNSQDGKQNKALNDLLKHTINQFKVLRAEVPLRQVHDFKLTLEEKELVREYGVFWGLPHNFNPHITMVYNIPPLESSVTTIIETFPLEVSSFTPEKIAVATIGYHGNVEDILVSFDL